MGRIFVVSAILIAGAGGAIASDSIGSTLQNSNDRMRFESFQRDLRAQDRSRESQRRSIQRSRDVRSNALRQQDRSTNLNRR